MNLCEGRLGAVARCQRGHFAGADHQVAGDNPILVLEEAALRRTRCARSIFVVGAAVAGTQEQPGLGKPADRTSKVSTVDGENLEGVAGDAADPAGNVAGLPIPWGSYWIAEVNKSRLPLGKVADSAEIDPGILGGTLPESRTQKIA